MIFQKIQTKPPYFEISETLLMIINFLTVNEFIYHSFIIKDLKRHSDNVNKHRSGIERLKTSQPKRSHQIIQINNVVCSPELIAF